MIQEAFEVCGVIFFIWVGWWLILSWIAWLAFGDWREFMQYVPFGSRVIGLIAAIVTYVRW